MTNIAMKDVCHRLDTAMRVPRKTCEIICGVLRTEIIEKEERIKTRHFPIRKSAMETHPCPFAGGLCFQNLNDTFWREITHAIGSCNCAMCALLYQRNQ